MPYPWVSVNLLCPIFQIASKLWSPWLTYAPLVPIYASVNRVSICSGNTVSPIRRHAIIWTNAGLLSIETNLSEILIGIYIFSFTKMHLKIASGKWWPFCLGLNVLSVLCGWWCVSRSGMKGSEYFKMFHFKCPYSIPPFIVMPWLQFRNRNIKENRKKLWNICFSYYCFWLARGICRKCHERNIFIFP